MSLAVPITNSLTFIFSLLTGLLLGESIGGRGKACLYLNSFTQSFYS